MLVISKMDSIPTHSDRNAVCLSFAHHIYLVCGWYNVFWKNSPLLLVGRSGLRSFHGTVIGQPLYLVLVVCSLCDILAFTFDVKLLIVYAFGLKHNKRNVK